MYWVKGHLTVVCIEQHFTGRHSVWRRFYFSRFYDSVLYVLFYIGFCVALHNLASSRWLRDIVDKFHLNELIFLHGVTVFYLIPVHRYYFYLFIYLIKYFTCVTNQQSWFRVHDKHNRNRITRHFYYLTIGVRGD